MTPDFALNFSELGISLLKRAGQDWVILGSVQLSDTEFATRIDHLRKSAEASAGPDFATKLILPNEHVFYLSAPVDGSGQDTVLKTVQEHSPIPVADAVIDWCQAGVTYQIALVSKEILQEAEDFAVSHGFNAVSFAAVPQIHQFATEPYFGTTRHAKHLLQEPGFQGRDSNPVVVQTATEQQNQTNEILSSANQSLTPSRRDQSKIGPWIALGLSAASLAAAIWLTQFSGVNPYPENSETVTEVAAVEESTAIETAPAEESQNAQPTETPQHVDEPEEPVAEPEVTEAAEPEALPEPRQEPEPDAIPESELAAMIPEDIFDMTGAWTLPAANNAPPNPGIIFDLRFPGIDSQPDNLDAIAFSSRAIVTLDQPIAPVHPAPSDTTYQMDAQGHVIPSADGALNPDGIRVFAGRPELVIDPRPESVAIALIAPAADPAVLAALATTRPVLRPNDLLERHERANWGGLTLSELASYRPPLRPASPQDDPEISADPTDQAVLTSLHPPYRPEGFYDDVVAVVLAAREPEPETNSGGGSGTSGGIAQGSGPSIPTSASVAREATQENVVRLNRLILIGVYGSSSSRTAIVRTSSGRTRTVAVGDRLDGGRVVVIEASSLIYQKNGRNITLEMPPT